ncbi:MAG: hypothetical protein IPK82_39330 [Polyangiaceae bacterium]|nr:hypothetical protein [Polyangiaceae bacterium]
MRTRVTMTLALAAITLPTAVGCQKSPRDRLQGRWLGEGVENFPTQQVPKATGWVKGTAVEFSGSKVTVTVPAETPRSGTFKVARVDGEKIVVAFTRDEGGTDETAFRFVNETTLRWDAGNGREIVMVKARN